MVKVILLIFSFITLYANSYENNCLSCHQNEKQLGVFMKRYTLKYSSEEKIKKAIFRFLKNPTQNRSIMPFEFIQKWGFKDASILNDEELRNSIDIYYKEYNLKSYIK